MNSKPIQQSIDPRKIRTDLNTQAREKTCDETVREYAEAMENGTRFPPIVVFFDLENELYILADGFHRLFAHLRVKPNDPIIIDQFLGNVNDARWYSIGANKSHGLMRSNEDKRTAVEMAFLHPNSVNMSDRQVADHVGVSHQMVSVARKRLVAEGRLSTVDSRIGADGRTYNITNIGKTSAAERICGGCGHYKSPRCLMDDEVYAPNNPSCEEFIPMPEEEPEPEDDNMPIDTRIYQPKEVRHR
ncbi:MAG: hypothetical protein FWD31_05730, partial [Planctomycetaceae bacterium]|nr:hypothetical protein [Planctomycetaceae bacterium]